IEHLRLDLDAVHVGAVAAAEVHALVALGGLDDLAMAAGGLDVLEADVALQPAAQGHRRGVERVLLLGAVDDDRETGHRDSPSSPGVSGRPSCRSAARTGPPAGP